MSLIQDITRGAIGFRAEINGTPAPWDDYWYNPLGTASSSGVRMDPEAAKRIGAVLACVGIISRNIAMMPVKIFTDTADGGKRAVPKHPVYGLLAFDAIAQVEEQTGLSLLIGVNWRSLQVRQLRALLYAALLKAQPDSKLEDLTRLIIPRHTTAIVNALVGAWIRAIPESSEQEGNASAQNALTQNASAQNPPAPEA